MCVYIYIYIHVYIYICTCICISFSLSLSIYIYIYTYIHTYIHIYIYISSVKLGTIQRRLAWPLREDDVRKSRSVNSMRRTAGSIKLAPELERWSGVSRGRREVGESTRVVLGDIQNKGVVQCSLDSCLLLSSFFARSPLLNYPPQMLTSVDSRRWANFVDRVNDQAPPGLKMLMVSDTWTAVDTELSIINSTIFAFCLSVVVRLWQSMTSEKMSRLGKGEQQEDVSCETPRVMTGAMS